LRSAKLGFDPHNVLTLQTAMSGGRYDSTAQVAMLTQQVLLRLETLPGVQSAAQALVLPTEGGADMPVVIEGRPLDKGNQAHGAEQFRSVSGHYFESFRIPLLRGRLFDQRDNGKAAPVVIVNEAFAKKYWANESPVGKIISIGKGMGKEFEDPSRQIVGVVGSVRETGIRDGELPVIYIPTAQMAEGLTKLANNVIPMSWAVRTATDPQALTAAVQKEFLAVDAQLPVAKIRTMEQVIAESTARQNFNMLLLSIFAAIALVLASVGIYALMSYSVQQRTQEIGIRMALGGKQGDMQRMVLGQGMRLTAIGVVIGLAGAYGLMRVLAQLLFGVSATDPVTFVAVALLLTVVAAFACWIPAYRATQVDPIIALRYE
jgi:predicted permease